MSFIINCKYDDAEKLINEQYTVDEYITKVLTDNGVDITESNRETMAGIILGECASDDAFVKYDKALDENAFTNFKNKINKSYHEWREKADEKASKKLDAKADHQRDKADALDKLSDYNHDKSEAHRKLAQSYSDTGNKTFNVHSDKTYHEQFNFSDELDMLEETYQGTPDDLDIDFVESIDYILRTNGYENTKENRALLYEKVIGLIPENESPFCIEEGLIGNIANNIKDKVSYKFNKWRAKKNENAADKADKKANKFLTKAGKTKSSILGKAMQDHYINKAEKFLNKTDDRTEKLNNNETIINKIKSKNDDDKKTNSNLVNAANDTTSVDDKRKAIENYRSGSSNSTNKNNVQLDRSVHKYQDLVNRRNIDSYNKSVKGSEVASGDSKTKAHHDNSSQNTHYTSSTNNTAAAMNYSTDLPSNKSSKPKYVNMNGSVHLEDKTMKLMLECPDNLVLTENYSDNVDTLMAILEANNLETTFNNITVLREALNNNTIILEKITKKKVLGTLAGLGVGAIVGGAAGTAIGNTVAQHTHTDVTSAATNAANDAQTIAKAKVDTATDDLTKAQATYDADNKAAAADNSFSTDEINTLTADNKNVEDAKRNLDSANAAASDKTRDASVSDAVTQDRNKKLIVGASVGAGAGGLTGAGIGLHASTEKEKIDSYKKDKKNQVITKPTTKPAVTEPIKTTK